VFVFPAGDLTLTSAQKEVANAVLSAMEQSATDRGMVSTMLTSTQVILERVRHIAGPRRIKNTVDDLDAFTAAARQAGVAASSPLERFLWALALVECA
jgi:hypothetical protein